MFNSCYIIRKTKYWKNPIPVYGGIWIPIIYIITPIIMFIPFYLGEIEDMDQEEFVRTAIFLLGLVLWGIFLLIQVIKLKKLRKFKDNGGGILKKAEVTAVKKMRINRGGRGYKIDVYYLEAEDGGMTYYSNGYTKGALLGTSIVDLQLLYAKYGFIFDENDKQKDNLLRKIDEYIAEKQYEIENSGFISKITKSNQLKKLELDRKIVSDGYIPPYWEIDGNRVTVGDIVDVYIDPNNPERYWVDIDFFYVN